MRGCDFLDTSVLLYGLDTSQPAKQRIARELTSKAVAGEGVISTQVLAEFAATLLQKFERQYAPGDVITILESGEPIPLIQPDGDMVRRAVEAHRAYGILFYDGMIVAAAERAGCEKIWSEDLNAGQKYFGVQVENPFA